MTVWLSIIVASLLVYSWKILGFMVPSSVLNHPVISRIASLLTAALLAAIFGVQGFTGGGEIQFDARIPAVGLAAILLWLRVPYVVMVAAAAALAAAIRFFI